MTTTTMMTMAKGNEIRRTLLNLYISLYLPLSNYTTLSLSLSLLLYYYISFRKRKKRTIVLANLSLKTINSPLAYFDLSVLVQYVKYIIINKSCDPALFCLSLSDRAHLLGARTSGCTSAVAHR
jgi:hypothetical protein